MEQQEKSLRLVQGELALRAEEKELYDRVIAISSLIHVHKAELLLQIEKIVHLLKPNGMFFINFIVEIHDSSSESAMPESRASVEM